MSATIRVVSAMLIAPLAALVVMMAIQFLTAGSASDVLAIGFYGALFAYPLAAIVALPYYFLLRRLGYWSAGMATVGGVALAVAAVGWLDLQQPANSTLQISLWHYFLAAVCGAAGAIAFFGVVGRQHR